MSSRDVLRGLLYAIAMTLGFAHNLYGIPSGTFWARPDLRAGYHGYDAGLVLVRVGETAQGHVGGLQPLYSRSRDGTPVPYVSQFGLPGVVLGIAAGVPGADPVVVADVAAWLAAFLTAGVLAAVFLAADRRYGRPSGIVATTLMCLVPIWLPMAPSIYWCAFLMLAPFAWCWCAYPSGIRSWRSWAGFLSVLTLLTTAKFLCGYEFASTVLVSMIAGAWGPQAVLGIGWRSWFRQSVGIGMAGLAGFGLALGVHAAQIRFEMRQDPLEVIVRRATARTVQNDGRDEIVHQFQQRWFDFLPERWRYPAECWQIYLKQPAIAIPRPWRAEPFLIPLWQFAVGAGLAAAALTAARKRSSPAVRGLAGAALIGFFGALTWHVLAVNHTCVHIHMNLITYFLPFAPLAFVVAGVGVGKFVSPRWVAIGCAVVLAACATTAIVRASAREDEPRFEAPIDTRIPVVVERMAPEAEYHYSALAEFGRGPMLATGAGEPAVLVFGWAVDSSGPRPVRSGPIGLTVDSRPIPVRVFRFDRVDLDVHFSRRVPGAGFCIVARQADVPAGSNVRIVAASADGRLIGVGSLP